MVQKRTKRISIFGARLTSVISVALVLFLLGMAALIGTVTRAIGDDIRSNIGFVIKMNRDCTSDEILAVRNGLKIPAVQQYTFYSADSILEQEKIELGEDFMTLLDENPFNSEFEVRLTQGYTVPDSITKVIDGLMNFSGVETIVADVSVLNGVDSVLNKLGLALLGIALVLIIVSIALINNTVSLSVYSRRFVIHTMKLVGATFSFIRRPFINASIVNGLIAGLISSSAIVAIRWYGSSFDPIVEILLPWASVALICLAIVCIGICLCMITTSFAANRYLNASYDDMYLK